MDFLATMATFFSEMDFFMYVLAASFVVGVVFVVYSVVNFRGYDAAEVARKKQDKKEKKEKAKKEKGKYARIEDKLDAFDASLSEADSTMAELDDKSRAVLHELDSKYRELLLLYNMIEEKAARSNVPAAVGYAPQRAMTAEDRTRRRLQNPRQMKILAMAKTGQSVSEIAKTLGIGKGEVSLVLELGKGVRRDA